jgi:prepilin-type N-terminal cleavage/methylation domain-containing protein
MINSSTSILTDRRRPCEGPHWSRGCALRSEHASRPDTGMTLIEVMIAVSILTIVIAVLFGLSTGMSDTAQVQGAKITSSDQARKAMIYATRDLRQAARSSISGLPGSSISYRVATDLDGNGSAVDVGGHIELSAIRQIQRDSTDANGDGFTGSQLVLKIGEVTQVLANNLSDDEDINGNGILDLGEDKNGNGRLDHGVWFERDGSGIRVTIQSEGHSRQGHVIQSQLTETVSPRN